MSKFTQYQVFIAIVEEGSVSEAAVKLNVTAPAISKQLARLEESLQVQLFHRAHKKLEISEAGQAFYPRCKAILAAITKSEEVLQSDQNSIQGGIHITLSKALGRSSLFPMLAQFNDQYPLVTFDVRFSETIEDLHDQEIDFAFRLGKLADSMHTVAIPLKGTQLIACATPQYLHQYGTPASLAELGEAKLIVITPLKTSEALQAYFRKEKVDIKKSIVHTSNDIEGVYQLVRANMGIGLFLDMSVQTDLEQGLLQSIPLKRPLPRKQLYLMFKKTQWQTKKHQAFKKHVKSSFAQIS